MKHHDWEFVAVDEMYRWHCKKCFAIAPYPSELPAGPCPETKLQKDQKAAGKGQKAAER